MKKILLLVLLLALVASAATFEVRVAAGTDDAMIDPPSSLLLTETIAEHTSSYPSNGFRFLNVTVPAGATIDSAVIFFTSSENPNSDAVTLEILCEEGDGATFSTYANYTGRDLTETSASWAIGSGAWDQSTTDFYKSADFASVVQEVVDGAWSSGNDLVVIIDYVSGTGYRGTYNYESSSGTTAAKLRIVYTEGAGCADTLVAPVFQSPANSATDQTNSVILDWSDSTQAGAVDFYQVQVDNNSDFSSITWADTTSYSADTVSATLAYSTTYYWRIRGASDCDTSAWSGYRSFTMEAEPEPEVDDTVWVCYIVAGDTTTGSRNAHVDSLKALIENDPHNQLPGTWAVSLLPRASAESVDSAYLNSKDLFLTWTRNEKASLDADYRSSVDQLLDTIHKPVICLDAAAAYGDPMYLGTAMAYIISGGFRIKDPDHFVTKKTYTNNYYFGDSLTLRPNSTVSTRAVRGMANDVEVLCRYDGDLNNEDADSALVVVLDSNATNAVGNPAPNRRAAFLLWNWGPTTYSCWTYTPWSARMMFYRLLRWAVNDVGPDTCIAKVIIARQGIDDTFLERGTGPQGDWTNGEDYCTQSYHYGGWPSLIIGGEKYESSVFDRPGLLRARTGALSRQMPDTTSEWAYDVTKFELRYRVGYDASESGAYSYWLAAFELTNDTILWVDNHAGVQPQSGCASYVAESDTGLINSYYFRYPDIPWDSPRANTRGVDFETVPIDSVYTENPTAGEVLSWDLLSLFDGWLDSTTNYGVMIKMVEPITGDGELFSDQSESTGELSDNVTGPEFWATIQWRAANSAEDLDSLIAFAHDSLVFVAIEGQAAPLSQVQTVSNAASFAVFTCTSPTESPSAAWLTNTVFGGGYTTYYIQHAVDHAGLAPGYYSTTISNECASVSNSPGEYKVVLIVYGSEQNVRPAGGLIIFR